MSAAGVAPADGPGVLDDVDRPLPPVMQLGITALVLVVASGVYLAAQAARHPSLVPPIVGISAAGVLVLTAAVLLARVREFAWAKFRMVFGWAFLEYLVIAGMLMYVFIRDATPGSILALFVVGLVIFALDIPMMFAFSVARYQPVPSAA